VLVGHRRLKAAAELKAEGQENVEPVWLNIMLGKGTAADAERLKIALVSNTAFKPLDAKDRERLAVYLYGEKQWSQEKIAQALRVTQRTISNDLRNAEAHGELEIISNSPPKRPDRSKTGTGKRGRPRGQHPPMTDQQKAEYVRLHDEEGLGWTVAEARVRPFDRVRASLTTEAMQVRGLHEAAMAAKTEPKPVEVIVMSEPGPIIEPEPMNCEHADTIVVTRCLSCGEEW
jgi:hypothetical protein